MEESQSAHAELHHESREVRIPVRVIVSPSPLPRRAHPESWRPLIAGLATFCSVVGGGLWWFGGPEAFSELSGSSPYRSTLPAARDRFLSSESTGLPTAGEAILAPQAGNKIIIPSLDLALPLVRARGLSVPDLTTALSYGVALYPNGVDPGTLGNAVVVAHNTGEPWIPYRFAFRYIHKLQKGDLVTVIYGPRQYTYGVTSQRVIDPRTTSFIPSEGPLSRLVLLTCWPRWTAWKRLVVEAELVSVSPLSSPTPHFGSDRAERLAL